MHRIVMVFLLVTGSLAAHCNCALHSGGGVQPQHGGQIEVTEHHRVVELVTEGDRHTVYVMNEHLKPILAEELDVSARILFPRGQRKPKALHLDRHGDLLIGGASLPGGLHRYTVEMTIQHKGEEEKVNFVVEP